MKKIVGILFVVIYTLSPFLARTQIINTIAGNGTASNTGNGGLAIAATINYPAGIAFDKYGNLYICLGINGAGVRKIDTSGVISAFAGRIGISGYSGDGGPATNAKLNNPQFIVLDTFGNAYITDAQNNRVRKVNAAGIITTIAGTGTAGYSGDGGPATAAMLYDPNGICLDKFGNLYIGDEANYRVRKIDTAGIISTVAGNGTSGFNGNYGLADTTELIGALGLCTDDTGNLYIADGYSRVWKVDTTGIISVFAGGNISGSAGDGGSATAAETVPLGVTFDKGGNMYIGEDAGYNRVRKVDASGIITTAVGTGVSGFSGDGGPATAAEIYYGAGVVTDACGNLYISDLNNRRIRKITYPPILTIPTVTLSGVPDAYVGALVTVTATVTNAGSSYNIEWYNHGVQFSTTTVPFVTYTKAGGIDTITARVVSTATYGCYDSTTSVGHTVMVAEGVPFGLTIASMEIYPNPVSDVLHIDGVASSSLSLAEGGVEAYTILSIVGAVIQQGSLQAGSNSIPIQSLPKSVYILEVTSGETRTVTKVVKQ